MPNFVKTKILKELFGAAEHYGTDNSCLWMLFEFIYASREDETFQIKGIAKIESNLR